MRHFDQCGDPYPDITTPEEFVKEHGKADFDCWTRDFEALRQHVFLNAANNDRKHMTWGEAKDFAEKVIEAWKKERPKYD